MTRGRLCLIALCLSLTACASARHRATVTVVSAHAVLAAIQDTEMTLVCEKPGAPAAPACVPIDTHKRISAELVKAFDADGKIATLVRATPVGGPSSDVAVLLGQIRAIVDAVLALIPDSAPRRALVANLGGAQ